MIDIHAIKYNVESEFHMLRHFESVDNITQQKLLSFGYTVEQIQYEMSLPGSKFFSNFANDIKELLEKILSYPYHKTIGINGNHIVGFDLPEIEFPQGIGTRAVISLEELSVAEKAELFYEKNRNFSLAHLIVEDLPVTNLCTLILKPVAEGYAFISAFSGASAMPIPDFKMTHSQFEACKAYWDSHVFLKAGR